MSAPREWFDLRLIHPTVEPPAGNRRFFSHKHATYVAYDFGAVWCLRLGRWLKPYINEHHHPLMRIGQRPVPLGRLILFLFDRPPEHGERAARKDGNPANCSIGNLYWSRARRVTGVIAAVAMLASCTAVSGKINDDGTASIRSWRFFSSTSIKYGPDGFSYTSDPAAAALKELAASALAAAPLVREAPQECPATPWPAPQSLSPSIEEQPAAQAIPDVKIEDVQDRDDTAAGVERLKQRLRASKQRIET